METLNRAKEVLDQILKHMNVSATLDGEERDDDVVINISSEDANSIIGKKGQTLDALQYIVNRIIHRRELQGEDQGVGESKKIILDSEGYREKRKAALENMARETAEIVRSTGKPIALEDLNARERWIVHEALKTEQGVKTESRGEGPMRKLIILPERRHGSGSGDEAKENPSDD